MNQHEIDRNLLFGVMALQDDLIDRTQFADVCAGWALSMERPLADLLVERGWITAEDRAEVERRLERKLKKHKGDVRATFGALANSEARDVIRGVDCEPIRKSLQGLTPPPEYVQIPTLIPPTREARQRYSLAGVLGQGGLGKVWLALDTDIQRKVAYKEIKHDGGISPDPKRFYKEAQITGQLEHPNIVPVYELARKPDDQPFYVMRYVRGDTLSVAIRKFHHENQDGPFNRVQFQGLLGAFLKVCDAIGYAHARGVVHRDLKPENIVVGEYGEAVVIDWGLAKLVDQPAEPGDRNAETIEQIAVGEEARTDRTFGIVGTPNYMAPEQVDERNDQVDNRTDIWALGAILFEILTGQPPATGATHLEIFDKIRSGNLPRARSLKSTAPPALEAVCVHALSNKPSARYQRVKDLADDVRRWIADEPVSVYPEPFSTRAWRWMRRHHTAVSGSAAALLVALVGTAAVLAIQSKANSDLKIANKAKDNANQALAARNVELDHERKRAEEREELAINAVTKFRDAVANNPELKNRPELEILRKTLLKEPMEFFRKLRDQLKANAVTKPEALFSLARASLELAFITIEIGDVRDAIESSSEALAIHERLVREYPAVVKYQFDLAVNHLNLACLYSATGRTEDALRTHGEALKLCERLARENPTVHEYRAALAGSHYNLANLYRDTGRTEDAMRSHGEALKLREQLAREHPTVSKYRSALAASHLNLAGIYIATGRMEDALRSQGEALKLKERLARENPTVSQYQSALATSHNFLAALYFTIGRMEDALRSQGEALKLQERLARENPTVHEYRAALAASHRHLAGIYIATGRTEDALRSHGEALKLGERLVRENPKISEYQSLLATSHNNLAMICLATGRTEDAMRSLDEALKLRERLARENPTVHEYRFALAIGYLNLALVQYLQSGRREDALRSLGEALRISERLARENPTITAYQAHLASCRYVAACFASIDLRLALPGDRPGLAARAVSILQQAFTEGWNNPTYADRDPLLAPLRDREDFQRLLAEMFDRIFPAEPFARP